MFYLVFALKPSPNNNEHIKNIWFDAADRQLCAYILFGDSFLLTKIDVQIRGDTAVAIIVKYLQMLIAFC